MTTNNQEPRERQAKFDRPRYFIYLKSGRLRPVDVQPGTFCVRFHGRLYPVFRGESDAEFFRDHPEAQFRLTTRASTVYQNEFTFEITTRDPEVYATGDNYDFRDHGADQYDSPREFVLAECRRLLADPHLCSNPERWRAGLLT